jgi:nicotinamide phosphoribosyltransferase
LDVALAAGYSATNIAFGMGGQLLQAHNRDTLRWAMKCSSITVNGEERDVFKDPVTDHDKISKAGRLDLIEDNGKYKTVKLGVGQEFDSWSCMRTVFENGEVLVDDDLETIRSRAKKGTV